jgi:predicted transposase YbfD/YdcC
MPLPIADAFADLPDPRLDRNQLHALTDILAIALCATIAGAEGWEQVAEYGRSKEAFFRRFLPLANGIPSHDTFYRVFTRLDPDQFAACFGRWMAAACEGTGLVPVAIDGKSARRSRKDTFTGRLHLVSAWAAENRLILGQVSVADGSHEIAAIPELLRVLDLTGALVTLDAAGCQVGIARQIREKGGEYLLAVKGNQPTLHAAVTAVFDRACEADFAGVRHDGHESVADAHGRHEERYVTVVYDPPGLPADWPDVAAVVEVNRVREVGGERAEATHHYLTSHRGSAAELGRLVRGHWGVENGLHWVLDVVFREDESRTSAGHAGANLGMLRRVAVSLLKRAADHGSIQMRRMKAAWDDEFLLTVLQGIPAV